MNLPDSIKYAFEYDRRLRVCFVGAGVHSYRNVYPAFRYAPIDLLAICDQNETRARAYARQFGAERTYADHRAMLEAEKPEAVFIVTSYHPDGRLQATDIAEDALRAGAHVWTEKPTAASVAEIEALMRTSGEMKRFVMTGLKKMFFPTVMKAREITRSEEFGRPTSIYLRYPLAMPALDRRRDLVASRDLLDHIYHPAAIIRLLMGDVARFSYEWEASTGASVTTFRFTSGAVGTLHFTAGSSGSSPLERLEVIGEGANLIVENGTTLTYYRRAKRPAYGRAPSFLVDDAVAPLRWEPEYSLGQLYNNNLFYLGYVPEILHFCEAVLDGRAPEKGTLEDAREIMRLFEAYCDTPPGVARDIHSAATERHAA